MHSPRLEIAQKDLPEPKLSLKSGGRRGVLLTSVIASMWFVAAALAAGGKAHGAEVGGPNSVAGLIGREKPAICENQTYALCAGASCFVFNNVAYCTCKVMKGDSISFPFNHNGGNICTLNAQGEKNGYMASTFSVPPQLLAPNGTQALYTCPRTSHAAYAKCDGGLCFTNTTGHSAPGSNSPVGNNQIVCSCPVEKVNPIEGLQIIGPYPCQKSFLQICDSKFANSSDGSILYDGTPIGSTSIAAGLLTSTVPALNSCP